MSKNIGEIADSVIQNLGLVKTAEVSYTSGKHQYKTELGKLMSKVAQELRAEAANQKVTYDDLALFRKRYGL
jgi:hypothetical protein